MRFKNVHGFGLLLALSFVGLQPVHAAPVVAHIYGVYDTSGISDLPASVRNDPNNPNIYGNFGDYDTPTLFFVNPSSYAIDNVQMVLTVNLTVNSGWNTYNNGVTQTVNLGTLGANGITQVSWGSGGSIFTYDYDDVYSNNYGANPFFGNTPGTENPGSFLADCTLNTVGGHPEWTNFCAPVGNFQVALTGVLSGVGPDNGSIVSALFGEYNTNGVYTGWEGLDPLGWSENATYDVHNGVVNGLLANICIGGVGASCSSPLSAVPEPLTLSLFGAGLTGMAALRRRKKAKQG